VVRCLVSISQFCRQTRTLFLPSALLERTLILLGPQIPAQSAHLVDLEQLLVSLARRAPGVMAQGSLALQDTLCSMTGRLTVHASRYTLAQTKRLETALSSAVLMRVATWHLTTQLQPWSTCGSCVKLLKADRLRQLV
jgi:hypothetical protein